MDEIKPDQVYTTKEAQDFLKISKSTLKRWLKKGIINANRIANGRYKILGREIIRLVSPQSESQARRLYNDLKEKTRKRIENW